MTREEQAELTRLLNDALPNGWYANWFDEPPEVEIVAPGNHGAGFKMATIGRDDHAVRIRPDEPGGEWEVAAVYEGERWMQRFVEDAKATADNPQGILIGTAEIAAAIEQFRFNFTDEATLQAGIARALKHAGIAYQREVRLGAMGRVDFMVGTTAIEVKIKGSLAALTRQVHRYASHDSVSAVMVVTSKSSLTRLPDSMCGKPIQVVHLLGSCL